MLYFRPSMNRIRHLRLKPFLLLSVALLLLRAIVPVGYMPATFGSGLLFELCPENVSTEFMQFLAGLDEQGHHDHGQPNHGNGHGDAHDDHRCPMGQMLLTAAAVDNAWQSQLAPAVAIAPTIAATSFTSVSPTHTRSRGPPA